MIDLYGHPFAAFVWKPLIALYERNVPFHFRIVDPGHPLHGERLADLSPTGQFPALVDGTRTVTGSDAVIDYLDLNHGMAMPMIPADRREAFAARELAAVFDDYVAAPMQRIVGDVLRPEAERDPRGVAEARDSLERTYTWLERRLAGRIWATGPRFGLADCAAAPALFYADWVHPIPEDHAVLRGYRARLLARPSIARVVDEARPFRPFFPPGAPDRD
jgi:glutathione S-transferase